MVALIGGGDLIVGQIAVPGATLTPCTVALDHTSFVHDGSGGAAASAAQFGSVM